ncbi:[NiFe]-hydrogenase assembly chaperone HybE [Novosphingobium sp. 1949]|uniref:[NiFe]-hydrogenase assembly chaperone HybE n=1 Tax=Novosphingobium organovorum TaxID=2930092 RepID=A0ABT0BDC1_9SPHN|nr:[NiFe]-hydrogenase assembly chaperone HybE [Novosphingobium organovorum]MCJ2182806.1 [NiFe]-hydrogenase assembly chaperone HybE [Novosphingobium organovorum]
MDQGAALADLHARIEATYRTIAETRMEGVPILNRRLDVALRGLRRYGENHVGVLVTPWFMNLLFVPCAAPDTVSGGGLRVGTSRVFVLPSGPYEALASYEAALGWHWGCSLFSPMFDFADMDSAIETAEVSLDLLFTAPDQDHPGPAENDREDVRAAMIRGKGEGSAQERLDAMARAEAAALVEAQAEVTPSTKVHSPGEAEPLVERPASLDRRALFGFGRRAAGERR